MIHRRILAHVLALSLPALVLAAGSVADAAQFDSPLSSDFDSIPRFIAGALRILVIVALPIISLFVVYSGFLFLSAQGNSGKLGDAKRNFMYVIVGAILILGAWIIATLIGGTVSQLTTG